MYVVDGVAYAGELVSGIEIVAARVVDELSMLVEFSTGETRLFDAAYLLEMPAFAPLADKAVFDAFVIDHGVMTWLDGDIDLAPESLYAHSFPYERVA